MVKFGKGEELLSCREKGKDSNLTNAPAFLLSKSTMQPVVTGTREINLSQAKVWPYKYIKMKDSREILDGKPTR